MQVYYRNSTMIMEVTQLQDQDGAAVVGATVEAEITKLDGSAIPGITSPAALSDEGAGKYQVTIPGIELVKGSYIAIVVTSTASGLTATSRQVFVLRDKGFALA